MTTVWECHGTIFCSAGKYTVWNNLWKTYGAVYRLLHLVILQNQSWLVQSHLWRCTRMSLFHGNCCHSLLSEAREACSGLHGFSLHQIFWKNGLGLLLFQCRWDMFPYALRWMLVRTIVGVFTSALPSARCKLSTKGIWMVRIIWPNNRQVSGYFAFPRIRGKKPDPCWGVLARFGCRSLVWFLLYLVQ